jgi:hypothetical protein
MCCAIKKSFGSFNETRTDIRIRIRSIIIRIKRARAGIQIIIPITADKQDTQALQSAQHTANCILPYADGVLQTFLRNLSMVGVFTRQKNNFILLPYEIQSKTKAGST